MEGVGGLEGTGNSQSPKHGLRTGTLAEVLGDVTDGVCQTMLTTRCRESACDEETWPKLTAVILASVTVIFA